MQFVIELFVDAAIIFLLARIIPGVMITSFRKALSVCLGLGLLNSTLGFLLRLPLNIMTLFFLGFFVRLIVMTLMVKLTARLYKSFEVQSWLAAFIIALCLALAGLWLDQNL